MSEPPRTRQASARQPHGVGTFLTNTVPDADSTTATTSSVRRSRRIAGEVADLESWPPQGTLDQRTRRSDDRGGNQQDYPAPPSSVFTFARPEPSIPSPGFTPSQTTDLASMNSHQNNGQGRAPVQPIPRRTRGTTRRTHPTLPNGMPAVAIPLALTQPSSRSTAALDQATGHAVAALPPWVAWQIPAAVSNLSPPAGHAQLARSATMDGASSAAIAIRGPFFNPELSTIVDRSANPQTTQHQARAAPPSDINLNNALEFPSLPLPRGGAGPTTQPPLGNTVVRNPWSIASGADRYPNDPPPVNPFALPQPPTPQPPRKICIICCDGEQSLVEPCLLCSNFYCLSCIKDMFEGALKDMSMMPAQCCSIISLSIALPQLTQQQADAYRTMFEEWLTPARTYCPVATCSAFISERLLIPASKPIQTFWQVLKPRLPNIIKVLVSSPHSRYFRSIHSPLDHAILEFNYRVRRPIFLDTIQRKLHNQAYAEFKHFMADMDLLLENSALFSRTSYNAVSTAGEHLRELLFSELGNMKIDIEAAAAKRPHKNTCFACPKCFMGICADCKQVAHPLKPCDTASRDQEEAIIATFGYKQCPKCGHAVKRMFGCRHMQCHCGAHWCWSCQKPIDECEVSGCGGDEGSDVDEDRYDSADDEDELAPGGAEHNPPAAVVATQATAPPPAQANPGLSMAGETAAQTALPGVTAPSRNGAAEVVQTSNSRVDPPASRTIAEEVAIWDGLPAATPENITAHVQVARRITEQLHGVAIQSTAVERPVDLDAGGGRRWHDTDLNFGEEPDEPMSTNLAWSCQHLFTEHRIQFIKVENGYPLRLECMRCFAQVQAGILGPQNISKLKSDVDKFREERHRYEDLVAQHEAKAKDEKKLDPAFHCELCTVVLCESCKDYYIEEKGADTFTV